MGRADPVDERVRRGPRPRGTCLGGGINNDRVARVNASTADMVEYLLPRSTNIRRVSVDNSSSAPAFWVGNNLGASLMRVEPLESINA